MDGEAKPSPMSDHVAAGKAALSRWAIGAAAVLLSSCSQPALEHSAVVAENYVAMGSSFAAGPGLNSPKPGTPVRCRRSPMNYPALLAQKLSLPLVDVTCGGATSRHLLEPWQELPAQVEALSVHTRLVTVTVGGNDLGYVRGIMGSSCRAGAPGRTGSCWETAAPPEEAYQKLEANLREVVREVNARAPKARLIFVQYLSLIPPHPCEKAWFIAEEIELSRAIGTRLASITARVARDTGSGLLSADELSIDHTPCSAVPWTVGMYPGYDGSEGASWHPNTAGMQAISDALAEQIINP